MPIGTTPLRLVLPKGTAGDIELPSGTYLVDEPLRIAGVRLRLRGGQLVHRAASRAVNERVGSSDLADVHGLKDGEAT